MFEVPPDLRSLLVTWYGSPGRHYHTLEHVDEVLERFQACRHEMGGPLECFAALLFHDAIYEVGRTDNEARSAELARGECRRWFDVDPDRVAELVLLTASHGRAGSVGADDALFLDCDMAILGAERDRYAAYAEAVGAEWAPVVSPSDYTRGRARFLSSLLRSERIFLSAFWRDRLEQAARENLEWELERLPAALTQSAAGPST